MAVCSTGSSVFYEAEGAAAAPAVPAKTYIVDLDVPARRRFVAFICRKGYARSASNQKTIWWL